jgi:hypothetical protein
VVKFIAQNKSVEEAACENKLFDLSLLTVAKVTQLELSIPIEMHIVIPLLSLNGNRVYKCVYQ